MVVFTWLTVKPFVFLVHLAVPEAQTSHPSANLRRRPTQISPNTKSNGTRQQQPPHGSPIPDLLTLRASNCPPAPSYDKQRATCQQKRIHRKCLPHSSMEQEMRSPQPATPRALPTCPFPKQTAGIKAMNRRVEGKNHTPQDASYC